MKEKREISVDWLYKELITFVPPAHQNLTEPLLKEARYKHENEMWYFGRRLRLFFNKGGVSIGSYYRKIFNNKNYE